MKTMVNDIRNPKKKLTKDKIWEKLNSEFEIIAEVEKNNYFVINSKQIKKYYEPRLVTKFDFESSLPKLFKDNKLGILPINRGQYIIGKFKLFHEIDNEKIEEQEIDETISIPDNIKSINFSNITSEQIALNAILTSGIINKYLELDNRDYIHQTVNGRMGMRKTNFKISDLSLKVDKVQIEIDRGCESSKYLTLIEAKNRISTDFLIRQVYFPFRHFSSMVKNKEIKNIFMTFSNGIYTIQEYVFLDNMNYNSIKLSKIRRYRLRELKEKGILNKEYIIKVIKKPIQDEKLKLIKEVSIPHSNSVERIMSFIEYIGNNEVIMLNEAVEYLKVTGRQVAYYVNALILLGLGKKTSQGQICLSTLGEKYLTLSYKKRIILIVTQILELPVFKEMMYFKIFRIYKGQEFLGTADKSLDVFTMLLVDYKVYKSDVLVNEVSPTILRKLHTLNSWFEWIEKQLD